MSLARILEQRQLVSTGNREQRVHIGGLAVEMHRQERARARGDGSLRLHRVHGVGDRVNVHEDRAGANGADGFRRGDEGVRHGDDFVAGANVERLERQLQRCRARIHGHAFRHVEVGRKGGFKTLNFRPQDEG